MALTVETGVVVPSADSYVSVAECSAYFSARGNEAWGEVENKDAALRKATQYIDAEYSFKGARVSSLQALAWPRYGVVVDGYELPAETMPRQLKEACCELALKAASDDLIADVAAQYAEEVSVGPIRKKMSGLANGGQKRFALVDALLGPLLRGGNGGASIQLVRA